MRSILKSGLGISDASFCPTVWVEMSPRARSTSHITDIRVHLNSLL